MYFTHANPPELPKPHAWEVDRCANTECKKTIQKGRATIRKAIKEGSKAGHPKLPRRLQKHSLHVCILFDVWEEPTVTSACRSGAVWRCTHLAP